MSGARVAVVIVTYQSREHIGRCLASVREHAGVPVEVVVVDNASGDGTAEVAAIASPATPILRNPTNVGFGAACNAGAAATRAPRLLFLNPDAELQAGALPALLAAVEADGVGAAGPRTRNSDGTPQLSFGPVLNLRTEIEQRRLVRGIRAREANILAEVDRLVREPAEPAWLSASCLLVRREAFDAVSGFDAGFFLYEEDVDLGYRLRAAGWRLRHVPEAEVVHHLGRSAGSDAARVRLEYHRSHVRLYRKHNGWAEHAVLRASLALRGAADAVRGRGTALLGLALDPRS